MSKVLIYSQEDLDLILELEKEKNEELQQENQELKKQLEETNKMIEKCGFVNIEQVMLSYCGLIAQQKEFIKWLEDESKKIYRDGGLRQNIYKEVLNKMQELEGSDSNE